MDEKILNGDEIISELDESELAEITGGLETLDKIKEELKDKLPAFDVLLKRCPKCGGYCPNVTAFAIHWKTAHIGE
ncbi:MAG: hypothetical protein K6C96_06180 [Butyrivibrio sp.]|nr:hypothetical protein [Butyrivibrio sp.]